MASYEESLALDEGTLVDQLDELAADERRCSAKLLAHLAAMDDRDVCRRKGYTSLYDYCVKRLRFSEAMSYWRMQAARATRHCPEIVDLLEAGELTLTTIHLIAPLIIEERGRPDLVQAARGKTKKEVEAVVAALRPSVARQDTIGKPICQATVEWVPRSSAASPAASSQSIPVPARPIQAESLFPVDKIESVDGQKVRLHFDIGPETAKLLTRAREVMRHKYPLASFEDIVKEALKLLLAERDPELRLTLHKENAKQMLTAARRVPTWVRRQVWKRDRGQCSFVGDGGHRCEQRSRLEFDHIVPYSMGGRSDDPKNIRLLCRTHNQFEGERLFGNGTTSASA